MRILNLEQGRPDRLTARRLLLGGLEAARSSGYREVKLIHGYGSHGKGGSIRRDVRSTLEQLQQEGKILGFIPGEEFGPFSELTRKALTKNWDLTRDPDYARGNSGITVVLLRR